MTDTNDKYVLATDDDFIQLKPVPKKIYDETNEEEFFMYWDNIPTAFDVANQTRKRKDWVKEAKWVGGQPIHGDKIKEIEVIYENGDSDVLEINVYVSAAATRKEGLEKFIEGSGFRMMLGDEDFETERINSWTTAYRYVGNAEYVEIPHTFRGSPFTSYYRMFYENSTVKSVKSTNPHVTNMGQMFFRSRVDYLDLSLMDTSSVTTMEGMFRDSSAKTINLNSFDTSNVIWMNDMFLDSKVEVLDLSSFDTSSWISIGTYKNMFYRSKAHTGYARTQRDANRLNRTDTNRPDGLTFVVGGAGYIAPKKPIDTYETTEELPVPFESKKIEDEYLAEGLTEVFQEGVNGRKRVTYLITIYDDGSETQEVLKEETIQEPIPKIVYIGTAEYESIEEIEREEVIPYFTEYVDDDSMYVGEEEVKREGEDGLVRLLVRITTFFDGTTQEEILEEETLKEAIPKLIHRGTKLEEDTRIEYEYIDYETEYIETDTLTEGREQVIQGGKRGEIRYVYAIKTLASGEIEEELISEQRTEPVNRIVYIGTRKAIHWVTEVYLLSEQRDRDYFVDKSREGPVGLSEEFGITLRERPSIPTAQMRHDRSTVTGRLGDIAAEDNYDNVEISLHFNYIDEGNARETYNKVANALSKMEPGVTRLRFSDDKDGSFRVLAEHPVIEELNNDLLNWGDFVVTLTLKPFRYIEQEEVELTPNVDYQLKQPLKNAQKTAQTVYHQTEANIDITMRKNNERIYTIDEQDAEVVITDAEILKTYGGEWR